MTDGFYEDGIRCLRDLMNDILLQACINLEVMNIYKNVLRFYN